MMFTPSALRKKLSFFGFHLTVLTLASTCALVLPPLQAKAATLVQTPQDFRSAAKEGIPSVVSISVKGTKKAVPARHNWGFDDDDSAQPFGNDFFQHFFGVPRKGTEQKETISGQASGFIISADGKILTNSHVVKDADEITVVLQDGKEFSGTLVGQDPNTDIAVIKIDAKDLPFLSLGNSDDLEVGQWVLAIGNPLGLQASVTVGVVSAKGRNNLDLATIEDFIQTDAAINRGNSGGPLMDLEGKVVGMNTAIVTNMSTGGYMGIGFAIPSNLIKHITDELIHSGTIARGFLGVSLQPIDSGLAKAFQLEKAEGALVAEVTKGSPAETAGLKQGDVILKYDQNQVTNIAALRNAISLMKPGSTVTLAILRAGQPSTVQVNIGTFPESGIVTTGAAEKENLFGFSVQELTPELAKSLGYKDDKGVVISKVSAASPAAWAGLKEGILIQAVNQQKVESVAQFNKEVEALEKGKPLLLLVKLSNGMVRYISLQVR